MKLNLEQLSVVNGGQKLRHYVRPLRLEKSGTWTVEILNTITREIMYCFFDKSRDAIYFRKKVIGHLRWWERMYTDDEIFSLLQRYR